jgi:hypothetical protein
MLVVEKGHIYEVDNIDLEDGGERTQTITFVRRIPEAKAHEGTLMQELLRVLINRIHFLNEQVPHESNVRVVRNLRECLVLMEARAAQRKIEALVYPEQEPACQTCGHIFCHCGPEEDK